MDDVIRPGPDLIQPTPATPGTNSTNSWLPVETQSDLEISTPDPKWSQQQTSHYSVATLICRVITQAANLFLTSDTKTVSNTRTIFKFACIGKFQWSYRFVHIVLLVLVPHLDKLAKLDWLKLVLNLNQARGPYYLLFGSWPSEWAPLNLVPQLNGSSTWSLNLGLNLGLNLASTKAST